MKNLIIVGCNGGLGSAMVDYFQDKFNLIGLSPEKNSSLADYYFCDFLNDESVITSCSEVCNKYSNIAGIIYCSGVTIPGSPKDLSMETWDKQYAINIRGYFMIVKYLYDLISRSPACSIVQINSKSGKKGSYKNGCYASSKFAGIGLTQSFALEFAEQGIRFNCVCPGNLLESPMWQDNLFEAYSKTQNLTKEQLYQKYVGLVPMKKGCQYIDVINAVEFLLSNKSSYMTGQAINVTGGQQLF